MVSTYGRAVLGIGVADVAVLVGMEIGKTGRRGGRVRCIFWGTVVKIWSLDRGSGSGSGSGSSGTCMCICVLVVRGRLKTKPGVVL